ncbi:hypothetical protein M885DRAFT_617312 [Pelagophyceae sp. CCMP2097]|nr:hypothetical protein M885DRAFT_617312 [Pelagophyceae sp. CCMP2097]
MNATLPEDNATLPDVNASLPEGNATEGNATLPEVNFTLPEVNFTLPEVNFTLPEVNFTLPEVNFTGINLTLPNGNFTEGNATDVNATNATNATVPPANDTVSNLTLLSVDDESIGETIIPGTGLTEPPASSTKPSFGNDEAGNATLPNATMPNATLPNATLPNATMPNATMPSTCTADSATWFKKGEDAKDCKRDAAWVGLFSPARCAVVGDDGSHGFEACPMACGSCATDECQGDDDEEWLKKNSDDKDCAWVGAAAGVRCRKEGADGIYAFEACPFQCHACSTLGCAWVGAKKDGRCALLGDNGLYAFEQQACAKSCHTCAVVLLADGICADAESSPERCTAVDDEGNYAFSKCRVACGFCSGP